MAESDANAEAMNGCDVCAVKCWTAEGCFGAGTYDWKFLCMPQAPCLKKVSPPMFLGKDSKLPLFVSLSFGLQHMLAMCVGIATSGGMLHANEACWIWNYDSEMCKSQSFLVSCSWIASGLLTMIQVFRCKIKGTPFYIGTGLVSVMGTSFTFLPIGQAMVASSIGEAKSANDPRCIPNSPYKGGPATTMDCQGVAVEAYGKFLGTAMVASLFEVLIAITFKTTFVKKYLFPPVVVAMAIMMIGGALIASGIKYLGGGVFCGQNMMSKVPVFGGPHICNESGDVQLAFGAPEHWGLALSVIFFGILIQCIGSPFLKSTFLFWSMCFGMIVASIASYTGTDGVTKSYWNSARIDAAPVLTFPWTFQQFPPGFDARYFFILLICSWITTAETIGDVKMTAAFSKIEDQDEIESRQQGGIMADGVNSIIACLLGSPPNTTFSQNNGILALTRCVSRSAGFSCAGWLLFIGLFGKIGAIMASVPMPIVGGVILQCFTMVFVAGIQIAGPLLNGPAGRRNGFIVMLSLAFGLGIAMEPQVVQSNGVSSFHGKNLDFNYGLWPGWMTCKVFPSVTVETSPATCTGMSPAGITASLDAADCALLGGTYTAAVTASQEIKTCANSNGFCCLVWDDTSRAVRLSLLIIIKTPYGVAVLVAALLNALLPFETDGDDEDVKGGAAGTESAAA